MTESIPTCANCGAEKRGDFCSRCGQNSRNYLRATHRVVAEFLSEAFELDSRLLLSLKRLLFYPGYLSAEFAAGRRASYVSPVRLYLVLSVLFFFLLSLTSNVNIQVGDESAPESSDIDGVVAQLDGQIPDEDLQELKDGLAQLREAADNDFEKTLEDNATQLLSDPEAASAAFLDKLPITMFVLLPLFALLLKLFNRQRYYSEHLVFALHLHAFFYVILTISLLVPEESMLENGARPWIWGVLEGLLSIACLLYCVVALKRFYRQSLSRTLVKFCLLFVSYMLLLSLGLVAALLTTVFVA